MKLPAWTLKLAAAATIPALIGAGTALSAPSQHGEASQTVVDDSYRPGQDGIDYAAITGPKGSAAGTLPACADPARRPAPLPELILP